INATQFDKGTRAAFWAGGAPAPDLAHLVAASGAFPGAFDPVYLGNDPHPYVDGGVVENLGVDGLSQYLTAGAGSRMETPGILIISDMSAEPAPPRDAGRLALIAAVMHAEDLVYKQLHARILATYSGGAYNAYAPSRSGYTVPARQLWPNREGN